MKTCRNCGKQLDDIAEFCPYCGEKVQASTLNKCKNCGAEFSAMLDVCPCCGATRLTREQYQEGLTEIIAQANKKGRKKAAIILTVILITIIIICCALAGSYYFMKYRSEENEPYMLTASAKELAGYGTIDENLDKALELFSVMYAEYYDALSSDTVEELANQYDSDKIGELIDDLSDISDKISASNKDAYRATLELNVVASMVNVEIAKMKLINNLFPLSSEQYTGWKAAMEEYLKEISDYMEEGAYLDDSGSPPSPPLYFD